MGNGLWTRNYVMILLATFFAAVTDMTLMAVLPVLIVTRGGSSATVGTMISGLVLASLITRPIIGRLLDHHGRRLILSIGAILYAVNISAFGLAASLPLLFVLRVVCGISQTAYFGAVQTNLADVVPQDRLVDGIGFFGIAASLAGAFAPAMGLVIYRNAGSQALFLTVAAASVVSAGFALAIRSNYDPAVHRRPASANVRVEKRSPSSSFGLNLPFLIPAVIVFFVMFGNSSVSNFLTAYGLARGIEGIGIFFTAMNVATVASRLFNGVLVRRFGMTPMLTAGMLLMMVAYGFLAFAGSLLPVLAAGLLVGLGAGIVIPLLNALMFQGVEPSRKGSASAAFGLGSDLGNGGGASFWGFVSAGAGYTATYLLAAVSILVAAVLRLTTAAAASRLKAAREG